MAVATVPRLASTYPQGIPIGHRQAGSLGGVTLLALAGLIARRRK
ncbi:MAG: GlyGly-CTERM sorting domain-containing protein [Fretibacterium sp.]|nr:GlyGly-CTERM sorting domain-containing protein [Fretibacterium sp.]